jgi:3-dehydroquinate synthetase
VIDVLRRFDLPTCLPKHFPRNKIVSAVKFDKKFQSGKIRFVVTPRIGAAYLATDVTLNDIREAVAAL